MLLKFLVAVVYRLVYELHHSVFLRPGKRLQKSKLVVVGSFRIGGAGKTPVVIELAKRFYAEEKSVAVLVHNVAKDEAALLEKKLPDCKIVCTGNRYKIAHELDGDFDIILCDDGFEDSRLQPDETILLDWNEPCELIHDLWPYGNCRSLLRDHTNITRILKCGTDVIFYVEKFVPLALWKNGDETCMANGKAIAPIQNVVVACGLGCAERFARDVEKCLGREIQSLIARPDHDRNFKKILKSLCAKNDDTVIVISEKDAARLTECNLKNVFVAMQKTTIL